MVEAIRPQPGHTVLELASGPGDTGLLAAELVAPGGSLISTDLAEGMVDAARARAGEVGVENAEFRAMDAEAIDLPAASVDGVLCRWGFMLMADADAALRETRRVLKPGGRVALAAWDTRERNPWCSLPQDELVAFGVAEPPPPGAPGPFAFGAEGEIERRLEGAGFTEIEVEALDLDQPFGGIDEWWSVMTDLNRALADALTGMPPVDQERLKATLAERFAAWDDGTGTLRVPARTRVAAATA